MIDTQYERKILLGKNRETREDVTLYPDEFALGGYFIGVRRVGKSTLLENLIVQDIKQRQVGVCVIDPHGDLIRNVIHRTPQIRIDHGEVILLDPKDHVFPFGLNIYECTDKDDPVAVEYTVNRIMSLFKKLWPSETTQPLVEDVVRNTAYTIIANDMTMTEIPHLLFNADFRKRCVANVRNSDVRYFWEAYESLRGADLEQWRGVVGRRIRGYTTSDIVRVIIGQKEKTLPLKDIVDGQKVLLVRLYSEMKDLTSMIGSIIVSQLLQVALSRSEIDDRPEFHLYCDEYANFATEDFAEIISEAGKYNLIPYIAHQSQQQISLENQDSAIQLGNLFCFRVIGRDAERLAVEFDTTPAPPPLPKVREKVITREVLKWLPSHRDEEVKRFWATYVKWWEKAVGKDISERTRTYSGESDWEHDDEDFTPGSWGYYRSEKTIKKYPEAIFWTGASPTPYDPKDVMRALDYLEQILYDAMREELPLAHVPILEDFNFPYLSYDDYRVAQLIKAASPFMKFKSFVKYYYATEEERANMDEDDYGYARMSASYLLSFMGDLTHTVQALHDDPIFVYPPEQEEPEEYIIHQTHADREREIANVLVHLKRGECMVKIPDGEFIIQTSASSKPNPQHFQAKLDRIRTYTRREYCKPRAQVEREIAARIKPDDALATKRKHTM